MAAVLLLVVAVIVVAVFLMSEFIITMHFVLVKVHVEA